MVKEYFSDAYLGAYFIQVSLKLVNLQDLIQLEEQLGGEPRFRHVGRVLPLDYVLNQEGWILYLAEDLVFDACTRHSKFVIVYQLKNVLYESGT